MSHGDLEAAMRMGTTHCRTKRYIASGYGGYRASYLRASLDEATAAALADARRANVGEVVVRQVFE